MTATSLAGHSSCEPYQQEGTATLCLWPHNTSTSGHAWLQTYRETGVLPRGLTHPTPLSHRSSRPRYKDASPAWPGGPARLESNTEDDPGKQQPQLLATFLTRWGAVPVSPSALVRLLKHGECVLLFPGGAPEVRCCMLPCQRDAGPPAALVCRRGTEARSSKHRSSTCALLPSGSSVQALKGTRPVDRYALYWSPRPEFVRAAARFSATIIPFGAVGCEENMAAIMNATSVRSLVEQLREFTGSADAAEEAGSAWGAPPVIKAARKGVNDIGASDDLSSVRPPPPVVACARCLRGKLYKCFFFLSSRLR